MTGARKWALLIVIVAVLVGAGLFAWSFYELGGKAEEVKTVKAETKAVKKAVAKSNAKVRADLARAADTGQARERDRLHFDQFFEQLAKEAADAPSAALDQYVLPDDRLRLWRDANAGRSTGGDTAGQPDGSAPATASAGIGSDLGAGVGPPGGSPGLPPARVANVPAAQLPATATGGL
jgi:hypothetical protein